MSAGPPMHTIAPDDIVRSFAEAEGRGRVPLLVTEPLERFLDEWGLGAGQVAVAPVGEGHSNVTYLITRGEWEAVLRRPPRPPLPPSAHDVLREARVLRALRSGARVPGVLAVCEDVAVIGAPFYVCASLQLAALVLAVLHFRGQRRARLAAQAATGSTA